MVDGPDETAGTTGLRPMQRLAQAKRHRNPPPSSARRSRESVAERNRSGRPDSAHETQRYRAVDASERPPQLARACAGKPVHRAISDIPINGRSRYLYGHTRRAPPQDSIHQKPPFGPTSPEPSLKCSLAKAHGDAPIENPFHQTGAQITQELTMKSSLRVIIRSVVAVRSGQRLSGGDSCRASS